MLLRAKFNSNFIPGRSEIESFGERILSSTLPSESLAEKISDTFTDWPDWLPIPLVKSSSETNSCWYTPLQAEQFLLIEGDQNTNVEWDDDFSAKIHSKAVQKGLTSYELAPGFST